MSMFKSKFASRLAIAKTVWLVVWVIGFFVLPKFAEVDMFLRVGILLWYTTLWGLIWIFWVMDKHPVLNFSMPYWFRGVFLWAWMNFVLVFFAQDQLLHVMQGTFLSWHSPFWLVLEWAIIGFIIDCLATKYAWEGKKLLK